MAYLQYSIKLHPGKLQDFVKLLNELTPVVAEHGWKLVGSYASVVGRLNTVVDLWELPSTSAIEAALGDAEMQKVATCFTEIIEDQVLTVLNKLPIG
jgi:NIPSNAP